jgi:hypothetical protein
MNGGNQVQKDATADISIFDAEAFMFYIIKFGEVLGVDALIGIAAKDRTISYNQKCKIIDHIIKTEADLGVSDSSWKHCLIYLFLSGAITEEVFRR